MKKLILSNLCLLSLSTATLFSCQGNPSEDKREPHAKSEEAGGNVDATPNPQQASKDGELEQEIAFALNEDKIRETATPLEVEKLKYIFDSLELFPPVYNPLTERNVKIQSTYPWWMGPLRDYIPWMGDKDCTADEPEQTSVSEGVLSVKWRTSFDGCKSKVLEKFGFEPNNDTIYRNRLIHDLQSRCDEGYTISNKDGKNYDEIVNNLNAIKCGKTSSSLKMSHYVWVKNFRGNQDNVKFIFNSVFQRGKDKSLCKQDVTGFQSHFMACEMIYLIYGKIRLDRNVTDDFKIFVSTSYDSVKVQPLNGLVEGIVKIRINEWTAEVDLSKGKYHELPVIEFVRGSEKVKIKKIAGKTEIVP